MKTYKKQNELENIIVGDLISLNPITNKVTRSKDVSFKDTDKLIIGVCVGIDGNNIHVLNKGMCDINVDGLVCIGDKLTSCAKNGKAKAIKYDKMDETIFNITSIGKVVGLYNDYSTAKVLLDIE